MLVMNDMAVVHDMKTALLQVTFSLVVKDRTMKWRPPIYEPRARVMH